MTSRRLRILKYVALGTVAAGALLVITGLVVIQTSWFKERLRAYAVARANEYLAGEFQIGQLAGSLWSGIDLRQVRLVKDGEAVVAAERLTVDYSLRDLIFSGLLLERLVIERPVVHLREDREGWNVARLVRATASEEDREGPARPVQVDSIRIVDGTVTIDRCGPPCGGPPPGEAAVRVPRVVSHIQADVDVSYRPVDLAVGVRALSFATQDPTLQVEGLVGRLKVVNDSLQLDGVTLRTPGSRLSVDGTVAKYATTPDVDLTLETSPIVTADFASVVPALARIRLASRVKATARGTLPDLRVELHVTDPAGRVDGHVRLQAADADTGIEADLTLADVDVGAILKDAALESDLDVHLRGNVRARSWSDLASIDGDMTVQSAGARAAGYAIDRARLDATLTRGTADVRLDAAAYGARVSAAGEIAVPRDGVPMAAELAGQVRGLNPRRLPPRLDVPRIDARVGADYQARYRDGRVDVDARFTESTIEGGRIAAGSTARVTAGGDRAPAYAFVGDVSGFDPARLGRALGIDALDDPRLAGAIDGHLDLEGSGAALPALKLRADIGLGPSTIGGVALQGLSGAVRVQDGRMDGDLAVAFTDLDPALVGAGPRFAGRLQGALAGKVRLEALGSNRPLLDTLVFDGGLSIGASTIGALTIDTASLSALVEDGRVTVRTLDVVGPALRGHVEGQVAVATEAPATLRYRLELRDLAVLGALAGQDLRGMGVLEGDLRGARAEYVTTGRLTLNALGYGSSIDVLQLEGDYQASIPDLRVADARGRVELQLTQPTVAGRELLRADVKLAYDDGTAAFDLALAEPGRTLGGAGRVVLHPEHREIHLERIVLEANRDRWQLATDGDAVIRYGAGVVEMRNVLFTSGSQRLAATGVLALDDAHTSNLDVRADRIDLPSVGRLALMPDLNLAGTLDASVTLTGTGVRREGRAEFSVSKGQVRTFGFEQLRGSVDLRPANALVDILVRQSADATFTVTGTIPPGAVGLGPVVEGAGMDVRVSASNLDLALVEAATAQLLDVSGVVATDLRLTGTPQHPVVSGALTISDAAFVVAATGADYKGFNARLNFAGERIDIESLRIADDDGDPLEVTGQLAISGFRPGAFEATFRGENFELIDNELGDVDADLDLTIKGEMTAPSVTGSVRVRSGRVEVDRLFEQLASSATTGAEPTEETGQSADTRPSTSTAVARPGPDRGMDEGPDAAASPPSDSGGLAVKVVIPDNLVVRGTDIRPANTPLSLGDMNVTLGGDFDVRKPTGQDAVVVGTIRTVRGTYEFQGRRFELLDDGRVLFYGRQPIDPGLDVAAEREIQGILAQVRIGGTAREPTLSLSSEPPLDEGEILALVVFNQPLNQLSQGQRVSIAERAGSMAAGFVVAPLAESLGRALDLDIFEVRGFGSNATGPTLRVGEQIGEKTFVSLEQGFGAQEVTQFMLEYQLSDLLRLKGSIAEGSGGRANRTLSRRVERSGIDLVLRLRY